MFNSIRTRLTLWFTGVLAVILIVFAVSTYLFLDYAVRRQTDDTLRQIAGTFAAAVKNEQSDADDAGAPKSDERLDAVREALSDLRFRDYRIFVSDANGKIVAAGDNQTSEKSSLATEQTTNLAAEFQTSGKESAFLQLPLRKSDFRVFAFRSEETADGEPYNIFVAHSLHEEEEFLHRFRNILLVSVPLLLIAVSLGGYFLARKTLAPVAQMSQTASKIGATNLHERLPIKNAKDELGGLALVINALLERLENSFETQRRFMADASHELRTPLAIVRGESEVAVSNRNRPPEELYESLDIVHDESRRLTRIVEDLFTLARADSGHFKANFKEIYLDELVADCLRKVRVLADKRNVSLNLKTFAEMPMRGDEQFLRRLFMNLLDNAIKYNHDGGQVSVSGETAAHDCCRITISDTGAGISEEQKSKIFERFYRADVARSRSIETLTSGAGLGLSIAQWIAEIHRGKIELVSSGDAGSVFAVVFYGAQS
jgi:heavy metal sensor kinase